ncbi:MAG TPA: hypothetical protein VGC41_24175 [Kofleriaceae bacterium]
MRLALVLLVACGAPKDPHPLNHDAGHPADAEPRLEKIVGNVLVEQSQPLYATEAAARAHAKATTTPTIPIALAVIADHGDVIEVTTKPTDDCVRDSRDRDYELTVFVPRTALIPRAATALSASYADGTAVTIERGAPVRAKPLAWRDEDLAATSVAPTALILGTPARESTTESAPGGEKLVCDGDRPPEVMSKWLARARKHARVPAPAPSSGNSLADSLLAESSATDDELARSAPACGVITPSIEGKAIAPTVDGHAVPWPRGPEAQQVFATARGFVGDVALECGRIRMTVARANIGSWRGGGASLTEGGARQWTLRAGPVVWPDGRPAGTLATSKGYFARDVEAKGDLVCVNVEGIADKVCHHRADTEHAN